VDVHSRIASPGPAGARSDAEAVRSLIELARGRRVVALTGAGCSTESGIPDYRGIRDHDELTPPPRPRAPIQHREFVDHETNRRRYWARSLLGWPRLAAAQPNDGHRAIAALEHAGAITGVITQNVDGLHTAAGNRNVVELHGALARVRCLACAEVTSRTTLQDRLLAANATWPARARMATIAPDGDVDLPDDLIADFQFVPCAACGGTLMPDVVFFGGSVPRATLDAAWALFDQAEVLLVIGSSLTVFSGYRFVRRASERDLPVAILNRGPTRGDPHATLRIDARCGEALPVLARALA
jgi:NAD-dependent SIR2 family protein deacetylase